MVSINRALKHNRLFHCMKCIRNPVLLKRNADIITGRAGLLKYPCMLSVGLLLTQYVWSTLDRMSTYGITISPLVFVRN